MKDTFVSILIVVLCQLLLFSCTANNQEPDMDGLYAWCIVPFDLLKRTPQERINMLVELGFSEYAYDWREEHIRDMADEWRLAQESNIKVRSVWMWLDPALDTVGQLSWLNDSLFQILKKEKLETEIWLGFKSNYFQSEDEQDNIQTAIDMVAYLATRADSLGCKIGLYNHGAWFGDPRHQLKVIQAMPDIEMGLIYNFHHGYDQVQFIPTLIPDMLPYLYAVNISGIVEGESDIHDFGTGDHELDLLRAFMDAGYDGPIGILGHRNNKDVKVVLAQNLKRYFGAKEKLVN